MDSNLQLPCPEEFRKYISELQEPVVFQRCIQKWNILTWTLEIWAEKLGDQLLPFRSGRKSATKEPQWEGNCTTVHLTMREFLDQKDTTQWLYFDYKHMHEWFKENQDILESISWDCFGFPERDGSDSTLWIGSSGAHTPCHLDTYGCNLVAQIFGSKQWILFPPESTASMLPTRVPYEESSIYSSRNFYCPSLNMEDELIGSRVITLQPGDVLFVPHKWWHYVENISTTAISINTWIPLASDDMSRLDESLVRLFISQVCKDLTTSDFLLNPNEKDVTELPLMVSISQIETSARMQCKLSKTANAVEGLCKKRKLNDKSSNKHCSTSKTSSFKNTDYFQELVITPKTSNLLLGDLFVKKRMSLNETAKSLLDICGDDEDDKLESKKNVLDNFQENVKQIVNAFCHPNVISVIRQNLISKNMKKF